LTSALSFRFWSSTISVLVSEYDFFGIAHSSDGNPVHLLPLLLFGQCILTTGRVPHGILEAIDRKANVFNNAYILLIK
jgi:hypothetical protein